MRAHTRRLGRVQHARDASPVRRHVLAEAYEWFTMFGELTDDDHVAVEVVEKALRAGKDAPIEPEAAVAKRADKARLVYHQRERPRDNWPPSVRAMLLDEALFEATNVRDIARAAIAVEVAYGGDVEKPGVRRAARHTRLRVRRVPRSRLAEVEGPGHAAGSCGSTTCAGAIDHDDPKWTTVQGKAIAAVYASDELPDDDLHLEGVLVNVWLDLLQAHKRGKGVAEGLELIRKLERAEGEEFEGMLVMLSGMAKTRQLL